MKHTAYSMQHTAYSIQHTAYSIQHTAYNNSIHHAAAKPQNARGHLGVDGVGYQKDMKLSLIHI